MKKLLSFQLALSIIYVSIALFLGIGWILNVVKFVKSDFKPSYKREIIRGVGIIAPPVGGVVGWLDIKDSKE